VVTDSGPISRPSETDLPKPKEQRGLGIVLAALAIAALGFGLLSHSWLANRGYSQEIGIGLRDNFACENTHCIEMSNGELCDLIDAKLDEVKHFSVDQVQDTDITNIVLSRVASSGQGNLPEHTSGAFVPTGWATFVLAGLGIVALAAAIALAALGKRPDAPISPCSIALLALMVALVCACVFVATKPGSNGALGVGIGFWVFGGGAVLGIAGAQLLARAIRPVDPDLTTDAMDPDQF